VYKESVDLKHLTRLSDEEDFIEFCHLESFKTNSDKKCSKIRKIIGLKIDLKTFGFLLSLHQQCYRNQYDIDPVKGNKEGLRNFSFNSDLTQSLPGKFLKESVFFKL
jgi:hypothetical protein